MVLKRVTSQSLLIVLILLILFSIAPAGQWVSAQGVQCPGSLPSRMRINQPGQVIARNGTNLREFPTRSSSLLGGIPENATFIVIGGPICAEDFTWWEVNYEGRTGWTAESGGSDYWLVSLAPKVERLESGIYGLRLNGRVAGNGSVERKQRFPLLTPSGVEFVTLEHIRFSLRLNDGDSAGLANISVFQTALIAPLVDGMDDLASLLKTRPDTLDMFALPTTLPALDMSRVLISKPAYVNFNGGTGIRFIGHFSYQPGFVPPDEIYYVFLGLSDDGEHYVQAFIPIRASMLPTQPPEDFNSTPYTRYLLNLQTTLDSATPENFTPMLSALDDLISRFSIQLDSPAETVAARFEAVRFTVDRRLASGAQGQDVTAADPFTAPLPLPAHVAFTLNGVPQVNDGAGNPVPHLSVFPADPYNFVFVGSVDALKTVINSGNPTPEIPLILPIINRRRWVAGAVRYIDFVDGRGVRFIAAFNPQAAYFTSSDMVYVFLGLTNDNASIVQIIVPVSADVLPDSAPLDLDVEAFLETYDTYVQDVERTLNNAEAFQFSPRLDVLDSLAQSVRTR